jgi:hypothetical protein
MAAHAGQAMAIDGVDTARGFRITQTSESRPYGASNTAQGAGRKCGNVDWLGHYWCYGHTPVHFPGDTFTFQAETYDGKGLQGSAIVERLRIFWNITEGDYIAHVVDFARVDELTFTGSATDSVNPSTKVVCAQGTKFTYGDAELTEIDTMMLDFRSQNPKRVTSSTNGGVVRARGSLDAYWQVKHKEHDPSQLPTLNDTHVLKFYVSDAEYWELTWGKVLASPNQFGVEMEPLDYIDNTLAGAWNAHADTGQGSILDPAGDQKWPYS